MATNKKRNAGSSYYYVDGNTVRKAAPQREPEQRRERRVRVDARARRNREREAAMNLGYVAFLTVAILAVVAVSGLYIYLQSDVMNRMQNVTKLESDLMNLQTDNDALEKRINTSMPLNEIKNKAINELGMTYPSSDQIIYYSVDTEDYMEQYEDIPSK